MNKTTPHTKKKCIALRLTIIYSFLNNEDKGINY